MGSPLSIRALFGLGNPGLAYHRNRHNAGFLFVDHLLRSGFCEAEKVVRRHGASIRRCRAPWGETLLVKPQLYMNLSGKPYAGILEAYGLKPSETLVVFDDLALPFGTFRIRRGGSSGGQKGMRSILEAAGTNDIPRIRIGIGCEDGHGDAADYVLSDFSGEEMERLARLFLVLEEALGCIVAEGIDVAMSKFNGLSLPGSPA